MESISKICTKCQIAQSISCFEFRADRSRYRTTCRICNARKYSDRIDTLNQLAKCLLCSVFKRFNQMQTRHYRKTNTIAFTLKCVDCVVKNKEEFFQKNTENRLISEKKYRAKNIEKMRAKSINYYYANKDKVKLYRKKYSAEKRKTDPIFKLRSDVSRRVRGIIKKDGSICNYLPFTFTELKCYLEFKFEPWMNWNNHGKYNRKNWKDDDQSTWTWQIDHIIPHSEFDYQSMTDDTFKQCWALANLRPLNSKQNILDGTRRTRHVG